MLTVPTALLLHRTTDGSHHDWLVGMPDYRQDPTTRLWAARVAPASRHWRGLGRFDLSVIAPHRRAYLEYQGAVSDGRGSVMRIDRGTAVILLWSSMRIVWEVRMRDFTGTIEAQKRAGNNWGATVVL
ncbi:MAG: hypothetical protein R3C45_08320 [Phycisphaerales bacterium]